LVVGKVFAWFLYFNTVTCRETNQIRLFLKKDRRGDLYAKLNVQLPPKLTAKQRGRFETLRRLV
jgi:hypothetical protein